MSSFLSAAENIARQRQNVKRDLKKAGESRAVERAFGCHSLFLVCADRKNVSVTVRLLYSYFWYLCDAVVA